MSDLGTAALEDFAPFRAHVAGVLGLDEEGLDGSTRLLDDLRLDDVSLFLVVTSLQMLNPHFVIPEQMDMSDVTLADLHWFFLTMRDGEHNQRDEALP